MSLQSRCCNTFLLALMHSSQSFLPGNLFAFNFEPTYDRTALVSIFDHDLLFFGCLRVYFSNSGNK